ncbi:MAG TPA: hypothetical protein P5205_17695 [Candidatus Paceibacterota bacterium]|nr:hypothetical protein [Verrucomicrobiota bacterium]HSA12198.1 hypothetical protein [Candidatus Paceibacterota bacterium]
MSSKRPINDRFTAVQIAQAAGITRQAVYAGLDGLPPTGPEATSDQGAAAWPFGALPLDWQLKITQRGVRRGFENGEQFLADLREPWKCPLPWDQVPEHQRGKAVKLQNALARALEMRRTPGTAAAQVEQAGLEDFKAHFGYAISGRHWRRLLHRTIERDAGEENWQRLEIYLDDRAFAAPAAKTEVVRNRFQHRELDEVIAALEDRQHPTPADRQFLWDAAFRDYERETAPLPDSTKGNRERRLFKASLAHYLFTAFPERTLCATEAALRRRFDEKLDLWRANGRRPEALRDLRPVKSGKFRKVQFPKDLEAIRDRAILHDGSISLAYRLLHEEGKLSKEFCSFYPFNVRTAKSEVPHAVRAAVAPMVEMCLPLRRGAWQARMRGPYIQRDWSGVKAGDFFIADDVTWNHYFKEQLPDGRFRVLRGECLVMMDLATAYALDLLSIAGHYNGEHIRSLTLKVHDLVGLPRLGYYFERGVWRSKLVRGERGQGTPVHFREAENGLASVNLKLELRHATTPRAKPIEATFRILQERMRYIPGFIGFNERTEEREREQALIVRANNQDPEALRQFPTQAEWAARISAVLERYNHDPQNGEMLQGKSPAEAWAEGIRNRPLRKLPDDARYILSTHRKEITVRQEGIILTIRGHRRIYFNEHTGRLIGQRVLAFYNLELPELLTVSDLDRKNYFTVRAVKLPAMSATREQLAEVNELRKAHMAPAKAIFGSIKHEVLSTLVNDNEQPEEVKELGRFHNAATARAKVQDGERGRKLRKLSVRAAAAGIELPGAVRNPDDALEAIGRLKHFEQALLAEEEQSEDSDQAQKANP